MKIRAKCGEIIFRNESNGYTVATFLLLPVPGSHAKDADSDEDAFTAVGEFLQLSEGDFVELDGDWKLHASYGQQFSVTSCKQFFPEEKSAIVQYLSSRAVEGVGPKMAEKIVDTFGENALSILRENPEKLSTIKGISAKKAQSISLQIAEKSGVEDLFLLLQPFGLGISKILSIYNEYGLNAQSLIRKDPYRLADEVRGIGFLTADALALSLGCDKDSPFRKKSAMMYTLRRNEGEGHTYMPLEPLMRSCRDLLYRTENGADFSGSRKEDMAFLFSYFWESISSLIDTGAVCCFSLTDEQQINIFQKKEEFSQVSLELIRVADTALLDKEIRNAKMLMQKIVEQKEKAEKDPREQVLHCSEKLGIELAPEQKEAVCMALSEKVTVITGGPGTGKTTIIRVICKCFEEMGKKIVLCAPTGRAAKRMTEATGNEAKTIHRLLEVERGGAEDGGTFFFRNEKNPIIGDIIIVDEVSMLDTALLFSFLRAVQAKSRIIFVGDKDQLPSVGSGNILSDMISSGALPVVRLTQIFRQAESSGIVKNAHKILRGEMLDFDQRLESDCMLVSKSSSEDIADAVVKLCRKVLPEVYGIDVLRDSVILSPSRKGNSGITELNRRLQNFFDNQSSEHIKINEKLFFVGSKVMQTRNNYDLTYKAADGNVGVGVFNGEVGFVTKISNNIIWVEMEDGRMVEYSREDLNDLEMAYALTVHKSQGSEYPTVILAIPPGAPMLNHRNLFYTALTRAKERIFIVSSKETLYRMIQNQVQRKRLTSFRNFLLIYGSQPEEA